MKHLPDLLDSFRRGRAAGLTRVWIGPVPADGTPEAIAAQLGYVPAADALRAIDLEEAASLLEWLYRESVAYGACGPASSRVLDEVYEALLDLRSDRIFWTNGDWYRRLKGGRSASWAPLSDATFDVGVIGRDADHAFIFWVEEED
jgi:hypothetical protein